MHPFLVKTYEDCNDKAQCSCSSSSTLAGVFQCFPCIHCLYVTSFLHGEAEELLLKRDFEEVQSKGCRIG